MIELLNTLYVMSQGAHLSLEHDTARVTLEGELVLRAPLVRLSAIAVFGAVTVTPFLIHRCGEDGRDFAWFTMNGRFRARIQGRATGNVLLRRAQHQALDVPGVAERIARQFVAAKVQNSRMVLLRSARETAGEASHALGRAAEHLETSLAALRLASGIDLVRGIEGDAARTYFGVFGWLVRTDRDAFQLDGRTRRPPRDRTNALLSFLYALLREDCASALEGVGLDAQVVFLHALRPGRPALALDLMEEFRPIVADRLALNMVNRKQLSADHFDVTPGRAVHLNEAGRRAVIAAYQERKKREVPHRLLRERVPLGLVPHVQARLLARHLRGDLAHYPPFVAR